MLAPFPHEGACSECHKERRCNYCGRKALYPERCTNGRCSACHRHICTEGGATSPGHGFGRVGGSHFTEESR